MSEENEIPYGYCHCGCGQKTEICSKTWTEIGWKKGEPKKWIKGHHSKVRKGELSSNWNGGKGIDGSGYIRLSGHQDHPKSDGYGRVKEHILIAENVLGYYLPEGVEIHHVNGIRSDNRNENLVICEDRNYHRLLHVRTRALKECGNVDWRKCWICKEYDSIENLIINENNTQHSDCKKKYMDDWYRKREMVNE